MSSDSLLGDDLFDAFIDLVQPTPEEWAAARFAASSVAGALYPVFHPGADTRADHLVAGSVGKRTAIRPLPIVDLLYLLPTVTYPYDALSRMEQPLREAFPDHPIATQPNRLLIAFEHMTVSVWPATEHKGGGFATPLDHEWIITNPVAEMSALRLSDSLNDGRTTRLLSLLKAWKLECSVEISSFALEVLAREFLSEYSFVTWSGTLSDFMAWARQRTPQSFTLPGNAARLTVGDAWHPAAEAAYWRCMLANRNVVAGDFAAAITEMRSLLGPLFAAPPAFNIWNVRPDVG